MTNGRDDGCIVFLLHCDLMVKVYVQYHKEYTTSKTLRHFKENVMKTPKVHQTLLRIKNRR